MKRNVSRLAIPVVTKLEACGNYGGTGCVIKRHGQFFLVTAAHLFQRISPPTNQWEEWEPVLELLLRSNQAPIALRMFNSEGNNLKPEFSFIYSQQQGEGVILDIVAIPIHELQIVKKLAENYGIISIDTTQTPPSKNSTLHILGYPSSNQRYLRARQPKTVTGTLVEYNSAQFITHVKTENGFSGGPIFKGYPCN